MLKTVMKRLFWFVICSCMLVGCQEKESEESVSETYLEENDTIRIVWQCQQRMQSHEIYFNKILKEKGYPYEVDFISHSESDKYNVDLIETGISSWTETYDTAQDIVDGKVIALDSFLDTEQGKQLKQTLPPNIWNAYKVNGKQYTVPSVGFLPMKIAYIWDKELAEKYHIHPETWGADLWEHKEELQKVYTGENATQREGFLTVKGELDYLSCLPGFTQPLGLYYPLVVREDQEIVEAEFLYNTPEYKEAMEGFADLYDVGICGGQYGSETDVFLEIRISFISEDAEAAQQPEDYWEKHDYQVIWQEPLWELSCTARETGITSESLQPEHAFAFLCALYTDADLTNALMWGEEGIDYELNGNYAGERENATSYISSIYAGNQFLGHVEIGQDPNRKEVYYQELDNMAVSQISGFRFQSATVYEKLDACLEISQGMMYENVSQVEQDYENLVQKYQDAGVQEVIEEWNRQFKEYQEK